MTQHWWIGNIGFGPVPTEFEQETMHTRISLMFLLLFVLNGCASMGRSNTRRATMVWRNAAMAEDKINLSSKDEKAPHVSLGHRRTGTKYRIYCPEPVGPATKLNDLKIKVTEPTSNVQGEVSNTQTIGKVYDLRDVIQFSQYAMFMNCVGWANGTFDSQTYYDINQEILKNTKDLIEAQIGAEAKAKVEAAAQAVVDQQGKVDKAEKELEEAKDSSSEDSKVVEEKTKAVQTERAVLKSLTQTLEESTK